MNKLTDLEICVRIAEIEGAVETLYSTLKPKSLTAVFDNRTSFDYNPLTDDGLISKLMDEYEVCVHYGVGYVFICRKGGSGGCLSIKSFDVNDKSTRKRAVCLAIIESHKDV